MSETVNEKMGETVDEKMGNTHSLTNTSTHLLENPIIQVKHLSKRYKIGMDRTYKTFSERVTDTIKSPLKRLKSFSRQEEIFWALKDINFEVNPGERVGIIGRNGAGKSTLLKILSRITHPTEGEIILRGRVGSLLEVGTGFHPELTGRENIYFNGAILGMKKQEIEDKFEEIVKFAEIEQFLDTPVKRYSSGMHVRLAFAVAAHTNPEILAVDEVLAVGDSQFQKKCLGKMEDVAKGGRTVLFVSHNMGAIQQLCTRVMLLNEGKIILDDTPRMVVDEYLTMGLKREGERVWQDMSQAPGDELVRLRAVRVLDQHGKVCTNFDVRDPVSIEMEYWVLHDVNWLDASFCFYSETGETIFVSADDSMDRPSGDRPRSVGLYTSTCHIPPDFLNDGLVYVQAALTDETRVHTIQRDAVIFNVGDVMDPAGVRGNYRDEWPTSAVRPRLLWHTKRFPLSQTQVQVKQQQEKEVSNV